MGCIVDISTPRRIFELTHAHWEGNGLQKGLVRSSPRFELGENRFERYASHIKISGSSFEDVIVSRRPEMADCEIYVPEDKPPVSKEIQLSPFSTTALTQRLRTCLTSKLGSPWRKHRFEKSKRGFSRRFTCHVRLSKPLNYFHIGLLLFLIMSTLISGYHEKFLQRAGTSILRWW